MVAKRNQNLRCNNTPDCGKAELERLETNCPYFLCNNRVTRNFLGDKTRSCVHHEKTSKIPWMVSSCHRTHLRDLGIKKQYFIGATSCRRIRNDFPGIHAVCSVLKLLIVVVSRSASSIRNNPGGENLNVEKLEYPPNHYLYMGIWMKEQIIWRTKRQHFFQKEVSQAMVLGAENLLGIGSTAIIQETGETLWNSKHFLEPASLVISCILLIAPYSCPLWKKASINIYCGFTSYIPFSTINKSNLSLRHMIREILSSFHKCIFCDL